MGEKGQESLDAAGTIGSASSATTSGTTTAADDAASGAPPDEGQPAGRPLGTDPAWASADLKPGEASAEPDDAPTETEAEATATVVAEEGQPQEAAPPEKKQIPEDDELDKQLNRAFDRWNEQKLMRPFVSPKERRRKASREEDDDEWDDDTDDHPMTNVTPPPIPPPTGKDQPSADGDPFDPDIREVIT